MSKMHYAMPTVVSTDAKVVRLGAGSTANDRMAIGKNEGKIVKFVGESRWDLAVAGDVIEAQIVAIDPATSGGYTIGSINDRDGMFAIADGLQATPGTGSVAVGDYVCAGSITAKDTPLPGVYPKVCKSTVQLGTAPADLAAAGRQMDLVRAGAWRVISIQKESGPAAIGDVIFIAPVAKKL